MTRLHAGLVRNLISIPGKEKRFLKVSMPVLRTLCYLSRDDHNRKITTRKQRTNVGKYSFVNRTVKSWNQLPAGLLVPFPCKLNKFRKRFKIVVTSKGIQMGIVCK